MALKVDTNIPYGNACDISITESAGMAEVHFAACPHGGPECLWFCFRLTQFAPVAGQKVKLVLKHSYNMLGGSNPLNMRPVVQYAGMDWERLGAPAIENLPDGCNLAVWLIDAPEVSLDVAYCYPYGRPEISALLSETHGHWRADTIGVSQGSRPLTRLSNDYGILGGQRPGIYLLSRQHSGETPGSWTLDGFLRYIATLGDDVQL